MLSSLKCAPRVAVRCAVNPSAAAARTLWSATALETGRRQTQCNKAKTWKTRAFATQAEPIAPGKQADTGRGSQAVQLSRVPIPAGTILVTIDGKTGKTDSTNDAPRNVHIPTHAPGEIHEPSIVRKDADWTMLHPIWKEQYVNQVEYTHLPPVSTSDKLALATIKAIRFNFDWMSGYTFGPLTTSKAITRMVFLETVAGVPGSVGAMIRHLASLRRMKRDGGWIATLMAEAENERMHLLTALEVQQPGAFMRCMVFLTQGVFFNFFFLAYLVSPKFCHRLVGYLEEEAVVTYTKILHAIDHGKLKDWATTPAPSIAKKYWMLQDNSTMRDVIKHIRADEASHRDVNHVLGSLSPNDLNPFRGGHA